MMASEDFVGDISLTEDEFASLEDRADRIISDTDQYEVLLFEPMGVALVVVDEPIQCLYNEGARAVVREIKTEFSDDCRK